METNTTKVKSDNIFVDHAVSGISQELIALLRNKQRVLQNRVTIRTELDSVVLILKRLFFGF